MPETNLLPKGAVVRRLAIALLPLDERPVNIALPIGIAAIAGANLVLPPQALWPAIREPGDADALAAWLINVAPEVDAVVASIDTLAFGGLIAARTTQDTVAVALQRLATLARLHERHPDLPIAAVSLVMRASNSYNPQEEPLYWAEVGKELHQLGALHHRDFLVQVGASSDDGDTVRLDGLRQSLPANVLADFELRRLRNHHVNLNALALASSGVIDPLLITADDTAEHAAGSVEQLWLAQWIRVLPCAGQVLMYPGADEVAAVLVARQLSRVTGAVARFQLRTADEAGLERIAKYENTSIRIAVERQLRACGAELTEDAAAAVLVIHTPEANQRDFAHSAIDFGEADHAAATVTADLVGDLIGAGRSVALADLRYANGGDPVLVDLLIERGIALQLSAYGGWNTAGNSLGSVVAAAAAAQIGAAVGTLDARAQRNMLLHRLLEDFCYQSVIRPRLEQRLDAEFDTRNFASAEVETAVIEEVRPELVAALAWLAPDASVSGVGFPWHRSFEINFRIAERGQ